MENKMETEVYTSSGNIFADLELPDADEQFAKAELAAAIRRLIRERGLTQTRAAQVLGTTQARVSDLYNGKIARMTYDRLLGFLNALDCDVQITLKPRREDALPSHGKTLVTT